MRKYFINSYWLLLSALVIFLDQMTKWLAVKTLILQHPLPVIASLNFTLRHNTGSAFGFLNQAGGWQGILFGSIAIIVSVILVIALLRLSKQEKWMAAAFALIIGGALGNLWDRVTLGYVVDFIDFYIKNWHFATFNVADSAITLGALMVAIETILW